MHRFALTLFVNGNKPLITEADKHAAQEICASLDAPCRLIVVDIHENPAAAKAHDIVATPTLLRTKPPPPFQVTGNLTDRPR